MNMGMVADMLMSRSCMTVKKRAIMTFLWMVSPYAQDCAFIVTLDTVQRILNIVSQLYFIILSLTWALGICANFQATSVIKDVNLKNPSLIDNHNICIGLYKIVLHVMGTKREH